MLFRRSAVVAGVSLVTIAALAVTGAGAAGAAPDAKSGAKSDEVHLELSRPALHQAKIAVREGSITVADGAVLIHSGAGRVLERIGLVYTDGGQYRQYPIDAALAADRKSVTLIPSRDVARSTAVPVAERGRIDAEKQQQPTMPGQKYKGPPRTREERDRKALTDFTQTLSMTTTIGMLVGYKMK